MSVVNVNAPGTAARVDMCIQDNQTWQDAFQIGVPGDTTWSFTGQNFRLDLKGDPLSPNPLGSLTSAGGFIVVDDPVNRVLNFNVSEAQLFLWGLVPGEYRYDLIMFDNSSPPIRVPLMRGKLKVIHGITGG
jgi:hypothetical protein